ncbi:AraC family transcriptional regulator [Nonomuraea turkmeniaca]|uniref:AraC family transcriptional regulator n=1 Tax=Nonomuraea turkmeniaca TaxID=103838 RepID=A0A5S4FJQ7_9ACTN|nr:helix-turn-helix transcriptional regulator [Nonomuraea turkmeniaca]TMR20892.1 AraC family transcriptional regulator [Nonomuraea turkmeniaca]
MDVLSDAVAAMRTGRPHASRTHLRAPWGGRFRPQQGAGFPMILRGGCLPLPALRDSQVMETLRAVHRPAHPWTVQSLAALAGLPWTEFAFAKAFKREFGTAPGRCRGMRDAG